MTATKKCEKCPFRGKTSKKITKHVKNVHAKTGVIVLYSLKGLEHKTVTRNDKGRVECCFCDKDYLEFKHLRKHHKRFHNPKADKERAEKEKAKLEKLKKKELEKEDLNKEETQQTKRNVHSEE